MSATQTAFRPRKRPTQRRAHETVAAILQAAARIFVRHGYAGATTNRIAETAGVSIGSLYEYFPNKDAILVVLVERHLSDGEAMLGEVAADIQAGRVVGLRAIVRRFVEAMVALHAAEPKLHRVLFEEAPRPPMVRRRIRAIEDRVVEGLALLLASDPNVRVADPKRAALIIAQVVDSLTHRWVLDEPAHDAPTQLIDELVALVLGYLEG